MAHPNISRNDPCPCGSGKKFKYCCIKKGIDWEARLPTPTKPPLPIPRPRQTQPPDFAALVPFGRVDARLKEVAGSSPEPAAWKDLVGRLSDATVNEERMRTYRAIRDAKILPDDAAGFLFGHAIEWMPSKEAAESEEEEVDDALDRHTLAMLHRFGADDLADLFANARLEYDRCYERGRQFFFGPPDEELGRHLRGKGVIE